MSILQEIPSSKRQPPSVAIIIAAYNAEATIARAVTSALAEREVTEVIVIDDSSTDNTLALARAQDDGSMRLKVLAQQHNKGPSTARNRGIRESTSSWIGILDADDYFLPGRISALLQFADKSDLIADDLWQVGENAPEGQRTDLLGQSLIEPTSISFKDFVLSNATRSGRKRRELGFLKPLMRRQFLADHTLAYQEHMRLGEDFELYTRALGLGARMLVIPAHGYVSVIRADSLSGQHSELDLLRLRDCSQDLQQSLNLSQQDKNALRQFYLNLDCRLQWRQLISAVKTRNVRAAIATFARPYPVPLYLLKQLAIQLYLRIFRRQNQLAAHQRRATLAPISQSGE